MLQRINEFFEATTIHGFGYMSINQTKTTRIIWTLIVLGATAAVSYFLYETLAGFKKNYTSTTVETRSVKNFEFPAVTFDPGDYNSEYNFLRIFKR